MMNYRLVETPSASYIELLSDGGKIASESDALDVVAICGEHQCHRLMLHSGNLTDDFFDLRTRLAGEILLKFTTYHIIVALVLHRDQVGEGRFAEMVGEANRFNREFRVFFDKESAGHWLVQ